jgi:hypothetical protein
MAKKFLVPIDIESYIDLNKNELRNAVVQNLSTAPSSPSDGQIYYDTDDDKLYLRANSAWEIVNRFTAADESKLDGIEAAATADQTAAEILALLLTVDGTGTNLDADKLDSQEGTYYLARANHTGTQTASTVSDFDTQVKTNRLDEMAAPTNTVSANSQRIASVGAPTADTDAATKAYVDATKQGLNVKDPVRVASTANVAIANGLENGDAIDGVTLVTGDRVLLKNQSTATENGVYVVVASGAASRSTDMDVSSEAIGGAFVWVNEGTVNGDHQYVVTTNDPITLGSTSIVWTHFASASGISAGDGIAKTGSVMSVDLDSNSGLTTSASGLTIASDIDGDGLTLTAGVLSRDTIDLSTGAVTGTLPIGNGGGYTSTSTAKTALGFLTRASATLTGDDTTAAFTVTHNLGTRDIDVTVYQSASPYAEVEVDIAHATTNTVTITFSTAPATGTDYRAVVIG